jgi:hypothetical protein
MWTLNKNKDTNGNHFLQDFRLFLMDKGDEWKEDRHGYMYIGFRTFYCIAELFWAELSRPLRRKLRSWWKGGN